MVNLIAKKKIGFRNGDTGEVVVASPLEYASLPDWIIKDPMYEWAKADGTITVSGEEKKTVPEIQDDANSGKDGKGNKK